VNDPHRLLLVRRGEVFSAVPRSTAWFYLGDIRAPVTSQPVPPRGPDILRD